MRAVGEPRLARPHRAGASAAQPQRPRDVSARIFGTWRTPQLSAPDVTTLRRFFLDAAPSAVGSLFGQRVPAPAVQALKPPAAPQQQQQHPRQQLKQQQAAAPGPAAPAAPHAQQEQLLAALLEERHVSAVGPAAAAAKKPLRLSWAGSGIYFW